MSPVQEQVFSHPHWEDTGRFTSVFGKWPHVATRQPKKLAGGKVPRYARSLFKHQTQTLMRLKGLKSPKLGGSEARDATPVLMLTSTLRKRPKTESQQMNTPQAEQVAMDKND